MEQFTKKPIKVYSPLFLLTSSLERKLITPFVLITSIGGLLKLFVATSDSSKDIGAASRWTLSNLFLGGCLNATRTELKYRLVTIDNSLLINSFECRFRERCKIDMKLNS